MSEQRGPVCGREWLSGRDSDSPLPGSMKGDVMTVVRRALFLTCLITVALPSQDIWPIGRHRLVLDCPGGPLPFGVLIDASGGRLRGWLLNGKERIDIPNVRWDVDDLVLEFPHFDSKVALTVNHSEKTLSGSWSKVRGAGKVATMKVRSVASPTRFQTDARKTDPTWVNGRFIKGPGGRHLHGVGEGPVRMRRHFPDDPW